MFERRWTKTFLCGCLALLLAALCLQIPGCIRMRSEPSAGRESALDRESSRRYPAFEDDLAYDGLAQSLSASLGYFQSRPAEQQFAFGADAYTAAHMVRSLEVFLEYVHTGPSARDLSRFIRSRYRVYRAAGRQKDHRVLFTGYFEPILQGSAKGGDSYQIPVYARPADLLQVDLSPFHPRFKGLRITGRFDGRTLIPYHDRWEIEEHNALDGKALPLAFLKSRVDLFFLQIQGSGKIYLDDGRVLNVHYNGANGRPYRSIGRLLIEEGKIRPEEMSMQKIRAYLAAHPGEMSTILNYNPSYVFFKTETDGPFGAIGVTLTPGRSLATDRRLFPAGALCYIATRKPVVDGDGRIRRWDRFARFVS